MSARVYLERALPCARERNSNRTRLPPVFIPAGHAQGEVALLPENQREKRAFRIAPSRAELSRSSANGSGYRCAPEAHRCARVVVVKESPRGPARVER